MMARRQALLLWQLLLASTATNQADGDFSGPISAWTAQWQGAVGEPFEVPWFTRQLWRKQGCPLSCHVDWNDGSTLMPRGPLLGQGDFGMTALSEKLPPCSPEPCAPRPTPGSPGSGNISLQLGSNQLWAISDKDWSKCHYDAATCSANGQPINLTNESANGNGCWVGWLPGCRNAFPRRVGLGGLNFSCPAFAGTGSRFVAEQRMREGVVSAGYERASDGATLTTTSLMDDSTKAMVTDLYYNASSSSASSVSVRIALWTYDMTVDTIDAEAVANSSSAEVTADGVPFIRRKTIPDSWNATAQIHASMATTVLPVPPHSIGAHDIRFTAWEVHGDSVVATITLPPGAAVSLVTVMHTSRDAVTLATGDPDPLPPWKQFDPLPLTLAYIQALTAAKVTSIRVASAAWWERFWAKSSIDLPTEPLIQFFWNAAQYVLGSASRPGKVVPALFGPWVINDFPQWYGDMTMDYNQQSAFYHVASSNHAELALPEIEAIHAYLPAARHDAINLLRTFNRSCDQNSKTGLTFPSHLSPYGFPGSIGGSPNGDLRMRWEGIWALSAHIWDWEYTRNVTTLRSKAWPLATGLAEMWRCWLVHVDSPGSPDGYLLVDMDDSWGEQNLGQLPNLINPNQPIAWLTRLFTFLPDMAIALNEPIPEWWEEVLLHLPPQPVSAPNANGGGHIFGTASNQMNIDDCLTAVWPAEVANILGETPDRLSLSASNNTLLGQGYAITPNPAPRYNDPFMDYHGIRGTHVWMAAARIAAAYPRQDSASCQLRSWEAGVTGDLLECLNVWLNYTMLPTSVTTFRTLPFASQGGTLEDASVAQAVNDVLLTSHGYGLRLFPIWSALRPTQSASFKTLRAKGAFLVSARYDGATQLVTGVEILSEAGLPCRLLSPWPKNATISVSTVSTVVDASTEASAVPVPQFLGKAGARGWFEFATKPGGEYSVSVAPEMH